MVLYTFKDGSQAWLDEEQLAQAKAAEAQAEIECLKNKLAETDYKAIKFAEGLIEEEDYAPIRAERISLRARIKEIEKGITTE